MEQDFNACQSVGGQGFKNRLPNLKKPTSFFIKENGITTVNFMYPAADGRLETLNFVINDAAYLDAILTCGSVWTVPACFLH